MENQEEKKEVKRTYMTDIAEISKALDGRVNAQQIFYSQVLTTEHGKSINDLLFVDIRFGLYFYTSRSAFEMDIVDMRKEPLPTYVVCLNSKNVYQIKNTYNNGK